MPVIVRPEDYDLWLDAGVRRTDVIAPLLRPYPAGEMGAYEVSPLVNNPSHDGPRCVESFAGGASAGAEQ